MYKSKVLVGFVLLFYVLFAVFEFNGNRMMAMYFHSLIIPVITIFYILFIKQKNKLFLLFMVCYSLADILSIVIGNLAIYEFIILDDIEYYVGNSLNILSYLFLIFKLGKSINFTHLIKHFKIHLFILTVLNFYLFYVLFETIKSNLIYETDIYIELTYNIVILTVLSIALLNYFYRDNKKSLYLFLGALCIVFSEIIYVAYIFVIQKHLLNFLSTTLILIAFYFFLQQSKLLNVNNNKDSFAIVD